jgi:mannose-6-phosphate isomerase
MGLLRFESIYQERVWGGWALAGVFGRVLPPGRPIGESWEVVDRPEAQSVVRTGPEAGRTLRALIAERGAAVMGPRWPAARPFPILVKWLDCRERLSLQVHPPAAQAPALGGEPKTENWFIAAAEPGAALIVGLRAGATRDWFERALDDGTLETCVHRFAVAPGDSILVRSGTVHAIDAGNLILEIQQNSDTTYRVYDWGRVGLDGKPRQLHRREAMASILWDEPEPQPIRAGPGPAVLADCAEFRIRRVPLARGERLAVAAGEEPRLLHVVRGRIQAGPAAETLGSGDQALLPFDEAFEFSASEEALLLVTDHFAR